MVKVKMSARNEKRSTVESVFEIDVVTDIGTEDHTSGEDFE
jgi:hypothetical protein